MTVLNDADADTTGTALVEAGTVGLVIELLAEGFVVEFVVKLRLGGFVVELLDDATGLVTQSPGN